MNKSIMLCLHASIESEEEMPKETMQSKGGKSRAAKLSREERSAIAKKAASARWQKDLPKAVYNGELEISGKVFDCAVLDDRTRVISETKFMEGMEMYRSGALSSRREEDESGAKVPLYLAYKNLKPFIDKHLRPEHNRLVLQYVSTAGQTSSGIRADMIPAICDVWLDARKAGVLGKRQQMIAGNAELLMRGLARVGIIALVDEATGYQDIRERDALARILETFISEELRPWVRTFPPAFYENLYRLRGLEYPPKTRGMPPYFGTLTNDIVYKRLAPGVLDELKRVTPRNDKGGHKEQLHRRLSEDVGHPKLREHLAAVIALMRVSKDYDRFIELLDVAHPKFNETMSFRFELE